jgi:hypothetical protein
MALAPGLVDSGREGRPRLFEDDSLNDLTSKGFAGGSDCDSELLSWIYVLIAR